MITIRLTTSTTIITTQFSAPGEDLVLNFHQCGYCENTIQSPSKFCSDNHRVMFWQKQKGNRLGRVLTRSVNARPSFLAKTPA